MEERKEQNRNKLKKYSYEKIVGKGTYGQVWKGHDSETGETIAIKETKIDADEMENGIPSNMLREISILKELDHENIVSLKDIVVSDSNKLHGASLYFIQEYCETDLEKLLQAQVQLDAE